MSDPTGDLDSGETSLELLFCTDVLGLSSLHYGWWEDGEELSLENLKLAQRRYTDRLVQKIPSSARRLLDVGCGTGDIARTLAARGHRVTAISPDRAHWNVADAAPDGLEYYSLRFEDLDDDRTFDLILMAESHNYFDAAAGFRQCRRYLCGGGHLLVCGIFGRADVPSDDVPAFVENTDIAFIAAAERHGLRLVSREDITSHVLPTLHFCRTTYEQFVRPTVKIAALWLGRRPVIGSLVRFAFSGEMATLRRVRSYYMQRFDAELFARTCRYETLLFVNDHSD